MKKLLSTITFIICIYALPCSGANINEIGWEDLIPKFPHQDDPLAGLSEEEAGDVEWIIYLREYLPEKEDEQYLEFYDEMNKALPELKKKGINVEEIVKHRRYINSTVNTELDNTMIKISGYVLPLDYSNNTVTNFLLVPYFGACIHSPPPPLNQIVHAVSDADNGYKVNELYRPVTVTGRLKAESSSQNLFLMDGSNDIDIGYSLSVEKIEDYKP